jgi:chemotaxis protein histidine kinase CheA
VVRAAHTLCGVHRTGGFPLVATAAKSLEQCLLGFAQLAPTMRAPALPVLGRGIRCVTQLAGRIRACTGFTAEDATEAAEVARELDALRQLTATAPSPGIEIVQERDGAEIQAPEVAQPAQDERRKPGSADGIAPAAGPGRRRDRRAGLLSFSRRPRNFSRRLASSCELGGANLATPPAQASFAELCIRSRAAPAWPVPCAWAADPPDGVAFVNDALVAR